MIHIVGHGDKRIFGLTPAMRLERQAGLLETHIVADANAVLDDQAIQWLADNPGTILVTETGEKLAIAIEPARMQLAVAAIQDDQVDFPVTTAPAIGERYTRKLRRRSGLIAISLNEMTAQQAERILFGSVYKGVTDLVTKWVWPRPALLVTRVAARLGLHPNQVTFVGLALTVIAGWLFFIGSIAGGLAAAWAMTFLDTVDGKLARVTVTSSRFGNWLDHGNDIIHPPLWWACLAHGLALNHPTSSREIWTACVVILACYVIARAIEIAFHLLFGFNAFLFGVFDTKFRLIVARRNVLLLIMTLGGIVGDWVGAFVVCAAWSVVSTMVQAFRIAQAWFAARKHPLKPCLA